MERMHIESHPLLNWWKKLRRKVWLFINRKHSHRYSIATHDCDTNGNLRLMLLMNLLQDVTLKHTCKLGYGKEYLVCHKGWMVTKYAIKIHRYPHADERVTVQTWISDISKLTLSRQFLITNAKGVPLIEATSKWGLVDLIKKRFLDIPPFVISKKKPSNASFAQPSPRQVDAEITKKFPVLFDYIDFNGHVNNALYPFWASECVSKEFRHTNSPRELVITFKKETVFGEAITAVTQVEGLKTTTLINSSNGENHAKVTIYWGKNGNSFN